jgi:hypothetical protein
MQKGFPDFGEVLSEFNPLEVAGSVKLLVEASHELDSFPALGENLSRLGIL